jgi:hypothetical protein
MLLTRAQRESVYRKYTANADGATSYRAFRRRLRPAIGLDCVMLPWCGMWLGIETDGHTHS